MSTSALFCCDHARVPPALTRRDWDKHVEINRLGDRNLTLRIENISHALKGQISPRANDLIHLAAYIYAADQSVSRGGPTEVFSDGWRREMHLCVPVGDPGFGLAPQCWKS